MHLSKDDFLHWAFPTLLENTLRGILAEYIVAQALVVTNKPRIEWADYDVESAEGIRIEVKSAAYLQSWHQESPSVIRFGIAPTRGWNPDTNETEVEPTRSSDVYVFCLFTEQDEGKADPLDTDQWQFHVVPTPVLNEELGGQKSMGLPTLEKLGAAPATFGSLAVAIQQAVRRSPG